MLSDKALQPTGGKTTWKWPAQLHRRLAFMLLVVLISVGGFVRLADPNDVRAIISRADWRLILLATLSTGVSYLCISLSFARVSRLLWIRARMRDMAVVGFITSVAGRVIAGIASLFVRNEIMGREGAALGEVLAVSTLHSQSMSLVMLALLPISLLHLNLSLDVDRAGAVAIAAGAAISALLLIAFSGLLLSRKLRARVLNLFSQLLLQLLPGRGQETIRSLDRALQQTIDSATGHPAQFALIMGLNVMDWAFSAAAMWLALGALGPAIPLLDLVTAFVLATVAGSIVGAAGGLGIQEGSMAWILTLLGASFEHAALASILFRIIYFFLPSPVGIGFYWSVNARRGGSSFLFRGKLDHETLGA